MYQSSVAQLLVLSLGNNFVVFKESAILVYGGQGPDNLGNGDYQDPYTVSHAVGCKNAASIARVPGGVVFAGDAGIYMLNESLQLEFIGKDVYSEYKENGTEVVSTVYNAKQNYVAFLHQIPMYSCISCCLVRGRCGLYRMRQSQLLY